MFWTRPVSPGAIDVAPGAGEARFRLDDVAIPDFFNFFNAVSNHPSPPPAPSHVSLDVRWQGGGAHRKIRDRTFDFAGSFVEGPATITFSAKHDDSDVVYRSVADGQNTIYAGVGHERNGAFF